MPFDDVDREELTGFLENLGGGEGGGFVFDVDHHLKPKPQTRQDKKHACCPLDVVLGAVCICSDSTLSACAYRSLGRVGQRDPRLPKT